jgi:hypothetical protein
MILFKTSLSLGISEISIVENVTFLFRELLFFECNEAGQEWLPSRVFFFIICRYGSSLLDAFINQMIQVSTRVSSMRSLYTNQHYMAIRSKHVMVSSIKDFKYLTIS